MKNWLSEELQQIFSTISAVFMYLKDILILDRVLKTSTFEIYDP